MEITRFYAISYTGCGILKKTVKVLLKNNLNLFFFFCGYGKHFIPLETLLFYLNFILTSRTLFQKTALKMLVITFQLEIFLKIFV